MMYSGDLVLHLEHSVLSDKYLHVLLLVIMKKGSMNINLVNRKSSKYFFDCT